MPFIPLGGPNGLASAARKYGGELVIPGGTFNNCYQFVATLDVTAGAGSTPTLDVSILQKIGGVWEDFLAFTQATGVTSETLTEQDADIPAFSGDLKLVYETSSAAAAGILTVDPAGSNNKYTVTGQAAEPTDDNKTTWEVVNGAAGAALSVAVVGTAITVTLARTAATRAFLESNLTGAQNDLRFTARTAGVAAGAATIGYVDPGANDAVLGVVVTGSDIVVNLGTDGTGVITSSALAVANAINQLPAARNLVAVDLKAANTGAGIVTAWTPAALSTGTAGADEVTASTTGQVITAVAASTPAAALVVVTNFAGNDGTGLCAPTGPTHLDDGTSFTFSLSGFGK